MILLPVLITIPQNILELPYLLPSFIQLSTYSHQNTFTLRPLLMVIN
jgi:hypothetical protein